MTVSIVVTAVDSDVNLNKPVLFKITKYSRFFVTSINNNFPAMIYNSNQPPPPTKKWKENFKDIHYDE